MSEGTRVKSSARKRALRAAQIVVGLLAAVGFWFAGVGLQRWYAGRSPAATRSVNPAIVVGLAEAAITRLDLDDAEKLLAGRAGAQVALARARLAIYRADCEGAEALLGADATRSVEGADEMQAFAHRCAGATVSGHVIVDEKHGVWIRLQDQSDRVLVPLIVDTIARARDVIERDLGARLPRPLRLDLVRDLFSLSAVSGLPLEAAETTGTVAVARYGRVTMISPRAMLRGYPWQDTLAHEITHLVLTRASHDRAPLWLQEGVAKREETRWRAPRAFDRSPEPALVAFQAEERGQSVGVDKLGPSIAMLPSADAAGIAFAEVTSFIDTWLELNGPAALPALLRDLRVTPDADRALRSVSGLGLVEWQFIWRDALRRRFADPSSREPHPNDEEEKLGPREQARVARLVELLFVEGFSGAARELGAPVLERAPRSAQLRFFVGRAAYDAKQDDFAELVPPPSAVSSAHGGYLALVGRSLSERGSGRGLPRNSPLAAPTVSVGDPKSVSVAAESGDAESLFTHALALDPLLPEVACEGRPWSGKPHENGDPVADVPADAARRALCEHVRSLRVRGSE